MLDSSDVDGRADVWSWCAVLYEALSGSVPFPGSTCTEVLRAILLNSLTRLAAFGVDSELAAIVERGLQHDREKRQPDILELRSALALWLAKRPFDDRQA
jgi:serine/threonine-protein kinase